MLIGGPNKDALMRQRRLEPGMRECTAIIIMPSFVPYASLEVSSNWFGLTDPKCKKLKTAQAMRMSRAVKAIQTCGPQVGDADCYRDGDLARLQNKAQQLEARLPLQSTMVQVPYENTLGGFSMFNNGVTDLAPELNGWYGATYINSDAPTTLFLVGNHFSVRETRVIAGGVEISDHELLSRQVMKVTIPAGAQLVSGPAFDGSCNNQNASYVDVHLATSYGVTSHLFIPAITSKPAKAKVALTWGNSATVALAFNFSGLGISPSTPPNVAPDPITATASDSTLAGQVVKITLYSSDSTDKDGIPLVSQAPAPASSYQFDKKGTLTIPGQDLVAALMKKYGNGLARDNLPQPIKIVKATITDPKGTTTPLTTDLTVNWVEACTSSCSCR
jgi:hypothetical protein